MEPYGLVANFSFPFIIGLTLLCSARYLLYGLVFLSSQEGGTGSATRHVGRRIAPFL